MTTSTLYFNLVKILTMAFVLGFCAYVVHADEVVLDAGAFQTCTDCMGENQGPDLSGHDAAATGPENSEMISVAVLNPDLSDFDSVKLAVVEIADLEVVAEFTSYSLKDINHDDKTDMVFYFSSRDLMPPTAASGKNTHDACLFVDIMKKDKTITNLNLCKHGLVISPAGEGLI